ncbi:MAG: spore coat protein CotJB [Clostridia bacterium]|nr:spore coat protein CotJB [Clostridia bacterium]
MENDNSCACANKAEALREIMALNFALTDLIQYLDTHPNDTETIKLYNNLVSRYRTMLENYQNIFGPLIAQTYDGSTDSWDWVDNPWPWNKEV